MLQTFKALLPSISFFCILFCTAPKINYSLKKQLDSVNTLDQKYRGQLMGLSSPHQNTAIAKKLGLTVNDALQHYWHLQNHIDSLNIIFIEKVMDKYGYPGKTLVGEPENEAAWTILQHSQKIRKYLSAVKYAAENKELPFKLYAMMLDRELSDEGKEQIYGTQAACGRLKNSSECFIWPVKAPANVNKLRKAAGFDLTVEENAKRLEVKYRLVKLSEIRK
jgi:antitoxin component of RelBE/YafQ-DinJ toxin-antitoxin module